MHRWILAAAIVAGVSYYFNDAFVADASTAHLIWKGSGVALLALWAATRARDTDGWLLTAVPACGAAGDMLIDGFGLQIGAAAFLAGHLIAVGLYTRNRRPVEAGDVVAAAVLLVATPVLAATLVPIENAKGVGLYALALGAMAATAWVSRFARSHVGLGALLFVMSDLLLFARIGPLHGSSIPDIGVWPLYFAGQALIATGVVRGLTR